MTSRTLVVAGLAATLALSGCTAQTGEGKTATAESTASISPMPMHANDPGSYPEIQQFGADTFADYRDASGIGVRIDRGAKVLVHCAIRSGATEAAPSAHGQWYLLAGPGEELKGRYAAANTFLNGSDPQLPLNQQNPVNPAIRDCTSQDTGFLPVQTALTS